MCPPSVARGLLVSQFTNPPTSATSPPKGYEPVADAGSQGEVRGLLEEVYSGRCSLDAGTARSPQLFRPARRAHSRRARMQAKQGVPGACRRDVWYALRPVRARHIGHRRLAAPWYRQKRSPPPRHARDRAPRAGPSAISATTAPFAQASRLSSTRTIPTTLAALTLKVEHAQSNIRTATYYWFFSRYQQTR